MDDSGGAAVEPGLKALALVCSLKSSPDTSSSELLARQVLAELGAHGVLGESLRVADHDVRPGVRADMGDGDEWPQILEKVKEADILVFATPTWLGHMSSVAQRVLERLDAQLSDVDAAGRPAMFGKVAVVAVVGNEDGAHKIVADSYQGLNDIGFTIPAQGCTYWNAEAMNPREYSALTETPRAVESTVKTLAVNSVHLARLLRDPYPAG